MTRICSTRRHLPPAAVVVMLLTLALTAPVSAQPAVAPSPADAAVSSSTAPGSAELRTALEEIDDAARLLDATRLRAERSSSGADTAPLLAWLEEARSRSAEAALVVEPELALVAARIEQVGAPSPDQAEAPEIIARRAELEALRTELDSALKRANLIQVEAGQLRDTLTAAKVEAEAERMNQRTRSPLSPDPWAAAARDLPGLGQRFAAVRAELAPGDTTNIWILIASLALALVLIGPAAMGLRLLGRRVAAGRAENDGRLRRSLFAFWMLLAGFLTSAMAATAVMVGLHVSGVATGGIALLLSSVIVALFAGAFVIALTEALLLVDRDEWRMVRIDAREARQLRPFGWIAAVVIVLATSSDAFIIFIQPPGAIATALQALIALACISLIIALLLVVGRIRARDDGVGGVNVFYGRVPTLALILLWPASLFILYRGAMGYVVWSTEMALWLVWGSVVLLTWYLLARLVDDACRAFFSARNRLARSAHARFGVKDNTLLQFGVLLSAALRLALVIVAGMMLLVPFGAGFTSFIDLFALLGQGVRVGEVEISPAAIVRALIVLFVVLAIFNVGRRWLVDSYLPTTGLDAGAVNSIGVITGYLGVAAAVLWSLAAFGIQVQQLAFLVSALSVGIGFGLQAITQNFVSGLILLAERPVRIGDRIKVGDQAGRIGRISVRATQIVADDGSRFIVPNSELITKTVESLALTATVTIRGEVAVPFDSDLDEIGAILLSAVIDHSAVRKEPSPGVHVGAITDGLVVLAWTASIASGDDAERVRGEIWLEMIRALRTAGVSLRQTPSQIGPA